jgi:dCTP deaminase
MSVLTGPEIRRQMEFGNLTVEGGPELVVGPNGVDLHLADELYVYDIARDVPIDSKNVPPLYRVVRAPGEGWILEPGRLYLGRTAEYTRTFGFVPDCNGRSSTGRLGLSVHATAGWGDDGFCGHWTLEISCVQPVIIQPLMRIAQIRYNTITGARQPYRGRYQDSEGVVGSRIHHE